MSTIRHRAREGHGKLISYTLAYTTLTRNYKKGWVGVVAGGLIPRLWKYVDIHKVDPFPTGSKACNCRWLGGIGQVGARLRQRVPMAPSYSTICELLRHRQ